MPRIPRGNDFKLAVVLKEYVKADGGQMSERDIDIASLTTVAVVRANGEASAAKGYIAKFADKIKRLKQP